MKTTVAIAALAVGVGTSAYAQLVKQDIITVNLTAQMQTSVSQTTKQNAGNWLAIDSVSGQYQGPKFYKTTTLKLTQTQILQYIGYVLHSDAGYYSSKANLVLVQGELSGFFEVSPDLANSVAQFSLHPKPAKLGAVPQAGPDGTFASVDGDSNTALASSGDSTFVTLANGRHFRLNPDGLSSVDKGNSPTTTPVYQYPVGHMQPWGQIFVQDPAGHGTASVPVCDNVTYFFALSVQECYDCFYMNSFVSDASFKTVPNPGQGPVCCNSGTTLQGTGVDKYYLSLSFDNTQNNPFLNPTAGNNMWVGVIGIKANSYLWSGKGVNGDSITPDKISYVSQIASSISKDIPFEARFTLNGIMTYSWKLGFINKNDVAPDFLGTGNYSATGYGFIGLFCQLLTGTATFSERGVNTPCCTDDNNTLITLNGTFTGWASSWYGPGAEYAPTGGGAGTGIAGTGYDTAWDLAVAAGNTLITAPYPPYPITPYNIGTSLTYHEGADVTYPANPTGVSISGWPSPNVVIPLGLPVATPTL